VALEQIDEVEFDFDIYSQSPSGTVVNTWRIVTWRSAMLMQHTRQFAKVVDTPTRRRDGMPIHHRRIGTCGHGGRRLLLCKGGKERVVRKLELW
jgi:hypothetical protein